MAINSSSIRHDTYLAVYGLVSSTVSSYGASTSSITVYGGFPDLSTITFPNVIIEPIEVSEDTYSVDSTHSISNNYITVIIHIFGKKNADLDIIADGVSNTFRNNQISGLLLRSISSDNNSFLEANEQKVKGKTLSLNFLRRG